MYFCQNLNTGITRTSPGLYIEYKYHTVRTSMRVFQKMNMKMKCNANLHTTYMKLRKSLSSIVCPYIYLTTRFSLHRRLPDLFNKAHFKVSVILIKWKIEGNVSVMYDRSDIIHAIQSYIIFNWWEKPLCTIQQVRTESQFENGSDHYIKRNRWKRSIVEMTLSQRRYNNHIIQSCIIIDLTSKIFVHSKCTCIIFCIIFRGIELPLGCTDRTPRCQWPSHKTKQQMQVIDRENDMISTKIQ